MIGKLTGRFDLDRGRYLSKIISGLVAIAVCCNIFLSHAVELSIHLTDVHGARIQEVKQGRPFLLHVEVADDTQNLGEPTIEHLDKVDSVERQPVSTTIMVLNNRQQIRRNYVYRLRIDTLGEHILGPAYFDRNTYLLKSSALAFFVVKDTGISVDDSLDPFIIVETDKNTAHVGEQILLTVRLCFRRALSQFSLEQFKSKIFTTAQLGKPVSERYVHEGHTWSSVRYTFALYAKKAGNMIIPSLHAQCEREKEAVSTGLMAHFHSWFGNDTEVVSAESQPSEVHIMPLPSTSKKHVGVGEVQDFSLSVDSDVVEQSKGITATISLTSNFNMVGHTFGVLNLPDNVRAYESKITLAPAHQSGFVTKIQEWVLQALQPGDITIPAQRFTYFDMVAKKYKSCETKPIVCTIKPRAVVMPPMSKKIAPIRVQKNMPQPLPLWVFIAALLVPVLFMFFHYGARLYTVPLQRRRRYRKVYAMVRAAQNKKDRILLYEAWVTLFTEIHGANITTKQLKDVGALFLPNKNDHVAWLYYVASVERYAFEQGETCDKERVYRETWQWLKRFRMVI